MRKSPLPPRTRCSGGSCRSQARSTRSTSRSTPPCSPRWQQVVEAANAAGIPVYGSDPVMVKSGALACVSVSNTQLGERSAEMAYDILNGKDVSEVPAEAMSDFQYVCSRAAADVLSITLPEDGSVTLIGG